MTNNFNPSSLSSWGQRIFNGANGIKQTAKEASVFSGSTPPPTTTPPTTTPPTTTPPTTPPPTTTPPTTPPASGACTASYAITNSWPGGFQAEVQVKAGSSAINGWTVKWTYANGQTISQVWNATITNSGSAYTARNVDYNGRLGAGASTSFGFLGTANSTNTAPAVTCTAS